METGLCSVPQPKRPDTSDSEITRIAKQEVSRSGIELDNDGVHLLGICLKSLSNFVNTVAIGSY